MAIMGSAASERRGRIIKRIALVAFLGTAGWVLLATPVGREAVSPEGRARLVAGIDRVVREAGAAGPLLFIAIYAGMALVLPATVATAAGAFVFGPWLGFLCNFGGALIAATVAFLVSRHLLRDFAARFLVGPLATLDARAEKDGFAAIFYLRMLFFPFLPLNYAAGVTRIRFRDYFLATLLSLPLGSFVFSFFFGSLKGVVATYRTPSDLLRWDLVLPAGVFVASFFIPPVVRRLFPRPPGNGRGGS